MTLRSRQFAPQSCGGFYAACAIDTVSPDEAVSRMGL